MNPDSGLPPIPEHDPQEGPTMREVRRIRAEVYQESIGRSSEEQRKLDQEIAREFGLELRPSREEVEREKARRTA